MTNTYDDYPWIRDEPKDTIEPGPFDDEPYVVDDWTGVVRYE